jgi:DNA helicase HerA-like ATPase
MYGDYCGEIIGGDSGNLIIRQKSDGNIEIGDLLVEEKQNSKLFLQVFNLRYGSQISESALENISGMRLEGIGAGLDFVEPHLRNYIIASAKLVLDVTDKPHNPKILPSFMGSVRHIKESDLDFLTKPENPLYLGSVRSGSKVINADIFLRGNDVIPHHILIPATTGRGKSNLIKVMLCNILDKDFCGILILDPHDEYYGKKDVKGLRDHQKAKDYLRYYSPSADQGAYTLVINLRSITPHHFRGISSFSEAQEEAMAVAYHQYRQNWID